MRNRGRERKREKREGERKKKKREREFTLRDIVEEVRLGLGGVSVFVERVLVALVEEVEVL